MTELLDPTLIVVASQGPVAPLFALKEMTGRPGDPLPVPHRSFIDIDLESEIVEASHSCENGDPEHVHRRVYLRVPAPADVLEKALEEYVESEKFRKLFTRLAKSYEKVWNDNLGPDDFLDREEGHFEDEEDAEDALDEIKSDLELLPRAKIMCAEECAPVTDTRDDVVELDNRWEVHADSSDADLREMAREIREDTRSVVPDVQIPDSVFDYLDLIRYHLSTDD